MAVWIHLFNNTGINQIVNVVCGGSTQQQSSFKTSGHRLSQRLQELRVEALKVWNQMSHTAVDSQLQM